MSKLQDKSEIYLASAEMLNKNNYYPPVAHCSYYACYQIIKHLWLYKLGKTDAQLIVLNKSKPHEGSHEVLINEILKFVKTSNKVNYLSDFRVLSTNILQLKKLRSKADYDDSDFDSTSSSSAIDLSKEIIHLLKKYQ